MSDFNAIQSIIGQLPKQSGVQETQAGVKSPGKNQDVDEPGFADVLTEFLNSVNDKQFTAVAKTNEIISGESQDLISVMSSVEESRLSFQLLLEIRNKLLESFKEIQRMQI
ncbi:MAG: flagellar hook-basal body complex protein FliE [Candidatus Marinimicrobia bacterium]|nr:flagellar hook-basal body complex protein FliE [Candidatus Neomarinimicrobiota bacterium]MCF7841164.1 flagellar hook-basal body complex protein FliE [Candidatus Neomarinimicrobiota bacterium]MCF7901935.1 flagellar hook-basal body complex protein FliE [Candidatus Neomarinimicrobiota bacterium]